MKEADEKTYELIAEEIETGNTHKASWTKAFSEAEGDENKTKALYIKYRYDDLTRKSKEDSRMQNNGFRENSTQNNSITSELHKHPHHGFSDNRDKISSPKSGNFPKGVNSNLSKKVDERSNDGIKIGIFLYFGSGIIGYETFRLVQFCFRLFNRYGGLTDDNSISIVSTFTVIVFNCIMMHLFFKKSRLFVTVYNRNLFWQLFIGIIFHNYIYEDMLTEFCSYPTYCRYYKMSWVWIFILYFIFTIYLNRSKRVKQTFVN